MTRAGAGSRTRPLGFNSATALTPWMTASATRKAHAQCVLQFGHGTDAVEDTTRPVGDRGTPRSFNSATALTPWMTGAGMDQVLAACKGLQFGHGTDAVDDP